MTEERKKAGKINAFSVPQERALFTEKFSLDILKDALLYFAFLLIIWRSFPNCKGFCFCVYLRLFPW